METTSKEISKMLDSIDQKKKRLDEQRPLPTDLLKNLDEWFKVEQIYSSNAIEGNTLTKSETALVVEKGLTVSGKSLKEHLEVKNYTFALDYIKELTAKTKQELGLKEIKQIHFLILKGIDDSNAGVWRKIEVRIAGSDLKLPDPLKIPELMQDFISWLHKVDYHPALVAIDVHYKFVAIHPFVDGNGRVARLLMNLLLMQQGYPPIIIDPKDRLTYIDDMQKIDKKEEKDDYYLFMLRLLEKSLDIYLEAAKKSIT